jgi:hypothetical protein
MKAQTLHVGTRLGQAKANFGNADVDDPAVMIEDFTTISKSGKRVFLDDRNEEDHWTDDVDDWQWRLRIQSRHSQRWVDDPDIRNSSSRRLFFICWWSADLSFDFSGT